MLIIIYILAYLLIFFNHLFYSLQEKRNFSDIQYDGIEKDKSFYEIVESFEASQILNYFGLYEITIEY